MSENAYLNRMYCGGAGIFVDSDFQRTRNWSAVNLVLKDVNSRVLMHGAKFLIISPALEPFAAFRKRN
jgi:hypothetical protein